MSHKTHKLTNALLALSALALLARPAAAADYTIKAGSTDVTVYLTLFYYGDSGQNAAPITGVSFNDSDLKASYVRAGGNATPISLQSQTVNGTHVDGGFVELSSTNMPGVYRLDLPDAVCAAGVPHVLVQVYEGNLTNAIGQATINLVGFDPNDSARLGLSALPNAAPEAIGGLITRGTGTGQLNVSGGRAEADVLRLNGDDQSLLDLQDFVDNAYDPDSNTVNAIDTTGYNNVLHVGANQQYPTIAAAQAVAASGDLIVVHSGTYGDVEIGKEGVTYHLAYGVTLDGSSATAPIFDGSGPSFTVLGHGVIRPTGNDQFLINQSTGTIKIVCDAVVAEADSIIIMSGGQLNLLSNRISGAPWSDATPFVCSGGITIIETASFGASGNLADLSGSNATVYLRAGRLSLGAETPVSGTAGTLIVDAFIEADHVSTNGLNAPSGVTVVALGGAIKVPSGRPSLSGSGTVLVSDAFAYDVQSATAANVIRTATRTIFEKLPSKDYLTGTANASGDIEMDDATGNYGGSVGAVAGDVEGDVVGSVGSVLGNVDGSVASVAGNVTGSVGSVNDPASIWNAQTSGMTTSGSIGKRIVDLAPQSYFDALFDGAPTFANAMDAQGYTSDRADLLDNLDMPIGEVRLQTPGLLASTTIDTLTSQTSFTLADGPDNDDALNGALVIITNDDNPAEVKKAVGLVRDYDGATRTVTLLADLGGFTVAEDDKIDVIATGSPAALWLGDSP